MFAVTLSISCSMSTKRAYAIGMFAIVATSCMLISISDRAERREPMTFSLLTFKRPQKTRLIGSFSISFVVSTSSACKLHGNLDGFNRRYVFYFIVFKNGVASSLSADEISDLLEPSAHAHCCGV